MSDFDKAFSLVIGVEGGYVNDPADPGGETKFGITKRDFPELDIQALTLDQAKDIYQQHYWQPVHGDELPWPLCAFVFDAAVNQGAHAATTILQKTLGAAQDGVLGPQTLALAKNASREQQLLYLADRALRYTGTRNFDRFGRGWLKRLFVLAAETE